MNEVLAAYVVFISSLLASWLVYERAGSRLVSLSVPLLASYSYLAPESIPVIIVGSITAYTVGEVAYRKLLFYGMRLFFLNSVISSFTVMLLSLSRVNVGYLLISTLPGLLAYDVHVSGKPIRTASFSVIFFTIQWIFTVLLVNFLKI